MHYKWDKKYLYWGITVAVIIAFAIVFYFLVLRMPSIGAFFEPIFVACQPILYGLIIAYLVNPLYEMFSKKLRKVFIKRIKNKVKAIKLAKILSVTLSLIILVLCIFLVLYLIIPQLFITIIGLIESFPGYIDQVGKWANGVLTDNPKLEESVLLFLNNASQTFTDWSTNILPQLNTIIDNVTLGITNALIFVKDFLIGIIVSIYLLSNKDTFLNQLKKLTYSIFGVSKANGIVGFARYIDDILGKTFKGMLLGSALVGVSCFLGMIVLDLPYPLLISLIVGITNMIPFFGPFIGAIPSFLLILLVSPIKGLYFLIFILILQQIEGNIIGPKLIGDSTGLSSFWVLFAILLFGSIFGIAGMIIGVPLFAVIYHFASIGINRLLKRKGLPTKSEAYENLEFAGVEKSKKA